MSLINPSTKFMWHLDRVYQWRQTGTTRPLLFEIDPSNKCNHDCPWCSFARLRAENKDMICYEKMKEILTGMKNMGVEAITWTGGGEPLMNPDICDMIEFAKSLGLKQGMFTNASLLNHKKRDCVMKNLDWIRYSVDGYDEKSYAENHGTTSKSWSYVLENIKIANNVWGRCTAGFGYIMNESNASGIEQAILVAQSLDCDYFHVKPVSHRPYEEQVSSDKVKEFYDLAKSMKKHETDKFKVIVSEYRFSDMMDEKKRGRNYKKCLSHHFQGAIGADSKVYFCDHHKGEKEYELGDLKKNTMEEIWNGEQRKKVIEYVDSTDLSQCQDCCRNHEANKFLWGIYEQGSEYLMNIPVENKTEDKHPSHI